MYKDDAALQFFKPDDNSAKRRSVAEFSFEDFMHLVDHLNNWSSESTHVIADGIDEVRENISREYSDGYISEYEREYVKECLEKIDSHLNEYPNAVMISISYDNEMVRKLMDGFVSTGKVVCVDEREG